MAASEGLLSPSKRKYLSTLNSSENTLNCPLRHSRQFCLRLKSSTYPSFRRSFIVSESVLYGFMSMISLEILFKVTELSHIVIFNSGGDFCFHQFFDLPRIAGKLQLFFKAIMRIKTIRKMQAK